MSPPSTHVGTNMHPHMRAHMFIQYMHISIIAYMHLHTCVHTMHVWT